jgi:hypothetical protein
LIIFNSSLQVKIVKVICFWIAFATPFLSFGQDDKPAKFLVGFNLSYARTKIKGTLVEHYKNHSINNNNKDVEDRKTINASVSVRWMPLSFLYLETGAGFYQKGGYYRNTNYMDNLIMSGNYLDIPTMLGLRTPKGPLYLFGEIGVSYGVMLGCKGKGCYNLDRTYSPSSWQPPQPVDLDKPGKVFDIQNPLAVIYGGGLEIDLNENMKLVTRVRVYDDLNYFFGNTKDFSIAGKGGSLEAGMRFRVK